MEYNSVRSRLIIPEYGRHFQKLVEHAISIKDDEERAKLATAIVDKMGQLNPHLKDADDYKHKLWDHLHIIADYKLEVESPFLKPNPKDVKKYERLAYSKNNIKYKHYGRAIESLIAAAIKYEDGEEKDALVASICNQMKKFFVTWNRNTVNDELIFKQLGLLSDDKLKPSKNLVLMDTSSLVNPNVRPPQRKNKGKNQGRYKYSRKK
ncbi:MAG: DUF4290 domain-containing protein [Flavobacteriales bacterium]|nr:DUF4290 domain-containing protein [Flavobacteriales bacterium]